jgi:hypothetical protein
VLCGVNEGNFRMNGSYNYAIRTGVTKRLNIAVALIVASLVPFPFDGLAWNIPGHMLSGALLSIKSCTERTQPQFQLCALFWRRTPGTKPAEKRNWRNCRNLNLTKCFLCSRPAGRMIFARGTKPRAVCCSTTWTSRSSQNASQRASRPCRHPRRISSQP